MNNEARWSLTSSLQAFFFFTTNTNTSTWDAERPPSLDPMPLLQANEPKASTSRSLKCKAYSPSKTWVLISRFSCTERCSTSRPGTGYILSLHQGHKKSFSLLYLLLSNWILELFHALIVCLAPSSGLRLSFSLHSSYGYRSWEGRTSYYSLIVTQ